MKGRIVCIWLSGLGNWGWEGKIGSNFCYKRFFVFCIGLWVIWF